MIPHIPNKRKDREDDQNEKSKKPHDSEKLKPFTLDELREKVKNYSHDDEFKTRFQEIETIKTNLLHLPSSLQTKIVETSEKKLFLEILEKQTGKVHCWCGLETEQKQDRLVGNIFYRCPLWKSNDESGCNFILNLGYPLCKCGIPCVFKSNESGDFLGCNNVWGCNFVQNLDDVVSIKTEKTLSLDDH